MGKIQEKVQTDGKALLYRERHMPVATGCIHFPTNNNRDYKFVWIYRHRKGGWIARDRVGVKTFQ